LIHVTVKFKYTGNIPIQTSSREVYQKEHPKAIWELNMPPNREKNYYNKKQVAHQKSVLLNGRAMAAMAEWHGRFFANCHKQFVKESPQWHVYMVEFWHSAIDNIARNKK